MSSSAHNSFRQIEHIFEKLVQVHPDTLEVPCPPGIVPETFANRLRKNARELQYFKWEPDRFSLDQFVHAWDNSCIRVTPEGTIQIGPRKAHGTTIPLVQKPAAVKIGLEVSDNREPILLAILLLHHSGVLTLPTHLVLLSDATKLQAMIDERQLNVAIDKHPDKGYLLF